MKTSNGIKLTKWVSHIAIIIVSMTLLTACGKKKTAKKPTAQVQTNPLGAGAVTDSLNQILSAVQCQNGGQRVPMFYQGQATQGFNGWISGSVSGQPGGGIAGYLPGQTFYGKSAVGDVIAVTQQGQSLTVSAYFCQDSIMHPQNQAIYNANLVNFALRSSYNCPGIGVVNAGRLAFPGMTNPYTGQPFYQDFWSIDAAPSVNIPGLCNAQQGF